MKIYFIFISLFFITSIITRKTMLIHYNGMQDKKYRKNAFFLSKEKIFRLSMAFNLVLGLGILYLYCYRFGGSSNSNSRGHEMVWHGGHPEQTHAGSCWCGKEDHYCMCTPNVAIDLIIRSGSNDIWLVRRKDTNQLATMGGFVDVDETAEQAVKRELKEEMGIDLRDPPILFGVYSDPRRDNRRRNVSVVYAVHLHEEIQPKAGDDAKEVKRISLDEIEKYHFFADHRTILMDYRRAFRKEPQILSTEGDFAPDITRSTCSHTLLSS